MNSSPLVEPGVKYFFNESLKQCSKTKFKYYSEIVNFLLFSLFFIILGGVLYYCYKDKERKVKKKEITNMEKQQFIIQLGDKMREMEKQKYKQHSMITNLPEFESEFEIAMKKFM